MAWYWLRRIQLPALQAKEEEEEVEGEEEKNVEEVEEGCSQNSSNRPMAASVDP